MFSRVSFILVAGLALTAFKAQAQEAVATATIIADLEGGANEFAFNDIGNLVGGIAGTGADGTTFIVSNQPTASAQPTMTATIVADATHVSAYYAGGEGSLSTMKVVQCGLDGDRAVCTDIVQIVQSGFKTAVTAISTANVTRTAIAVSSITADASVTPGLLISGDQAFKSLSLVTLSAGIIFSLGSLLL